MKHIRIPDATIRRLSKYSLCLEELERRGQTMVSSDQLASRCRVKSAQLRRDLDYFGRFGIRGVGYDVKGLHADIRRILGVDRVWRLALIGVGNLGSSLLVCQDLLKQNYEIVVAFDSDPARVIGRLSERVGRPVEVLHVSRLKEVARDRRIDIGLITTPPFEAQEAADHLVWAGIRGILNFAPAQIIVPDGFTVKDAFFTSVLDHLAYHLSKGNTHRRYREEHEDEDLVLSRTISGRFLAAFSQSPP